ncbi:isoprenylcysteine carboxylmethyltransferase family protein [uncultured Alsobacter sp.]|uniref:isoprenylcysteine carboxyl methyltransferase family protein n=1 Tax=uncultured Alsobacter sp. TaxID=1748258 RepID=UPI0025EAD37E|nr:isoprenylcysteine carboxylmethyltransferase family protein [uncultured Alsobacter sp.]
MTGAPFLLAFLTLQRLAELAIARANTARLLARGAVEHGRGHYPLIVAFHTLWLAGLWIAGWDRPLWLPALPVFVLLQAARLWVLATLGRRWTTRIIVVPGERLAATGPFRFVRHPNYWIVAGEILTVPLILGLPAYAVVATIVHAGVLWIRIRAEEAALAQAIPARAEVSA